MSVFTGQEMEQSRASEVQRGGGDVKGSTASKHREVLRLLGGFSRQRQQEGDRPGDGAHDIGHPQNVRAGHSANAKKHLYNIYTILAQRQRRWDDVV